MKNINICLLGDYSDEVLAHKAILASMHLAQEKYPNQFNYQWMQTSEISHDIETQFSQYGAMWIVPASPYENMQGVLDVLEFIRTHQIPFLGTCGGYQHALLEYALNVLNIQNADHAETNPDAIDPIITALACSLIEKTEVITIVKGTLLDQIYPQKTFQEQYHCSFGFNTEYLDQFKSKDFVFSAFNQLGEVRSFELSTHPFYIGTSFQPERTALEGKLHLLVESFIVTAIS